MFENKQWANIIVDIRKTWVLLLEADKRDKMDHLQVLTQMVKKLAEHYDWDSCPDSSTYVSELLMTIVILSIWKNWLDASRTWPS